ncbi:hypothetical protein QNO07_02305 [Streptomyces sp. 549]|uniref:hypothetical protein n=1 Tax=Streptomyces sp. 549 TaxID=3049076 RepID=UPI0024C3E666|nr:hypothetical protein [Streptomyces sp. 549]MDK1472269.1 hypothetical protein [Streptomyces sp. 549]
MPAALIVWLLSGLGFALLGVAVFFADVFGTPYSLVLLLSACLVLSGTLSVARGRPEGVVRVRRGAWLALVVGSLPLSLWAVSTAVAHSAEHFLLGLREGVWRYLLVLTVPTAIVLLTRRTALAREAVDASRRGP